MSRTLSIELVNRPLDHLEVELAVVGSFSDERPLRGGAGRADWRLCGLLSDLLEAGRLSGDRGEVLLSPSFGRLRASRVLWFGLGSQARFRPASLRKFVNEAVGRAAQLELYQIGLAPLGFAPDDLPRHAEALLTGAASGARHASSAVRLQISLPREEAEGAYWALEEAARSPELQDLELTLKQPSEDPHGEPRTASLSRPSGARTSRY